MRYGNSIAILAATVTLGLVSGSGQAFDETNIRDRRHLDSRGCSRPASLRSRSRAVAAKKAPLTPEYQANFEANLKDLSLGGEGNWPGYNCIPPGMPAMMNAYEPMDISCGRRSLTF